MNSTYNDAYGIKRISDVCDLIKSRTNVDVADLLLVSEVGSSAHGIGTTNDDLDIIAIYMERWEDVVFSPADRKGLFIRTAEGNNRSQPGDIDVQLYTLRKFAGMIKSGNPSLLAALFSQRKVEMHRGALDLIHSIHDLSISKLSGNAFSGYMHQQIERWRGNKSNNVSRPKLVAAHGYDTKYAGHALRLGIQGIEYMKSGEISMPMKPSDALYIRQIRNGFVPEAEALEKAESLKRDLELAIAESQFQERPNEEAIRKIVSGVYRGWYEPVTVTGFSISHGTRIIEEN